MKHLLVGIGIALILVLGYLAYTKQIPTPHPLLPNFYTGAGFFIRYPDRWSIEPSASGVKITIDPHIADGTNLGSDTSLSVGPLPEGTTCEDSSSTGAGAGNRYEEWTYVVTGTTPCLAVKYFIHYGVIENYTPGAVKEFDRAALLAQFDAIRRTLVIAH